MNFYSEAFQFIDMERDMRNSPPPRNQYEADVLKYKNNYMKGITTALPQRSPITQFTVPVENTPRNGNLAKATTDQSKLYSNPLDRGIMTNVTDVFQNGFRPNKTTYGA